MIAKQTNHGKAANNTATATARAATAKPCRRTDASATGRAGDVPAAANFKERNMRNRAEKRREQHLAKIERRKTARMKDKAVAAYLRKTSGHQPTAKEVRRISRALTF